MEILVCQSASQGRKLSVKSYDLARPGVALPLEYECHVLERHDRLQSTLMI